MKKGIDINGIMNNAISAGEIFRQFNQEKTNSIVKAVYEAGFNNRIHLAQLAFDETKLGVWKDKVIKNIIATRLVYEDIKDQKTVGIISEDPDADIVSAINDFSGTGNFLHPSSNTQSNPNYTFAANKSISDSTATAKIAFQDNTGDTVIEDASIAKVVNATWVQHINERFTFKR